MTPVFVPVRKKSLCRHVDWMVTSWSVAVDCGCCEKPCGWWKWLSCSPAENPKRTS